MQTPKYIKADVNILMEYIYDDQNLISEPYEILINTKDNTKSFLSTNTSITNNTISNQLFVIDPVARTFGIVGSSSTTGDVSNYPFLQLNNYASGFPLRYDTLKIHLPINYTFGQYLGFYLNVYAFDTKNENKYNLSNFFFDISNTNTTGILQYTNPPILFQEKLWGKEIDILIPSLYTLSGQLTNNVVTKNSINNNLTGGAGLNQQSPMFFEFSFITAKQTISGITTYNLKSPIQLSLPQIPEFQQVGVKIQHSQDGDYFEIFGIYNDNIADFNTWITNSVYLGFRYYITYTITIFEQNLRGASETRMVADNFNEMLLYRPIIKTSTTTAVIDVDMNIIDAVSNSTILRSTSYGMFQDEVSKYGSSLSKINLANASVPKIYNVKNTNNTPSISQFVLNSQNTNIQTVNVPYAVLINANNVVAKSNNIISNNTIFYGDGKLVLMIKPFDNIIKITIAQNVVTQNNTITPQYMDLTSMGIIQLVFKNSSVEDDFDLFLNNGDVDLSHGTVVFLIQANKINDLKTIYNSGVNVFYITSTQNNIQSVIYSGLFNIYDSANNVNNLNAVAATQLINNTNVTPTIIPDTSATTTPILQNITAPQFIRTNNINVVSLNNAVKTNIINKNIS
jgi:hypothetical protein